MREYKQALKVSEGEREALVQENTAQAHASSVATIPTRSHTPDTPSREVVLESEPHGEEFEYFRNVLFEYMMGRQSQYLLKAIAALARFTDTQKKQLFAKESYF